MYYSGNSKLNYLFRDKTAYNYVFYITSVSLDTRDQKGIKKKHVCCYEGGNIIYLFTRLNSY